MAKKDKKKRLLDGSDIALAILAALGGAVAFMTVVAVAGSIMFPDSGKRVTADQPPAQTVRGTLPSRAPSATPTPSPVEPSEEPSNEPEPEPSAEPVQQTTAPAPTQAPAQTQAPAPAQTKAPTPTKAPTATPSRAPAATPSRAPATQNPAPAISVQPVQQSQAPAQSGNQSGATANPNGRTIYVTNTGQRYHYDNHCNGGNYYEASWDVVQRRNLTPCNRCVLN